jgi:hypothetical protein
MKRLAIGAMVGVFALLVALPVMAQQPPPGPSVSFGGEMRVHGFWFDNMTDFRDKVSNSDTGNDQNAHYFQRWRLFTTVESADKKARAVWGVEVGDLVWGTGGGASAQAFNQGGGAGTRIGPGSGADAGNDGVNIETKLLYVQFDIPGIQGANLLLGGHNIVWLGGPTGAFLDDDGFGIQFNWKQQVWDLQLYTVKATENLRFRSDDNDLYAARVGVNPTKDLRLTIEALVLDQKCFAQAALPTGATQPPTTCVTPSNSDFFDTYWIGGTMGLKVGKMNFDLAALYGIRRMQCPTCGGDGTADEEGFGVAGSVRVPVGPVSTWFHGWYTTGDERRVPGAASAANGILTRDSDKLPLPIDGASWLSAPFIAEALFGHRTLGSPAVGQTSYADQSGTYGIGGSGTFAVTPALSVGGGIAFVAATEDNGRFGDNVIEFDGGILYTYNANLSFQGVASYLIPEGCNLPSGAACPDSDGDSAWALAFRTRFAF